MSASGVNLVFPEDLERCIFESAALIHPDCIPALLLVAHRVKIWIEPLFYKVVTIYGPPSSRVPKPNTIFRHSVPAFYNFMKSKPASFFPDNVRHIQLVGVPIVEILKALAACNATINLALFDVSCVKGDAALLDLLGAFSLQRLSVRHLYWLNPNSPKWDFAHPLSQITHLDLPGNHGEQWADWSLLASIPRLTHLSFSEDFLPTSSRFQIFDTILEHCKSLQVLAIVFSYLAMLKFIVPTLRLQPSSLDPRVVLVVVADRQAEWETGARGGDDYWITAERLVEKHRAGDFDDLAPGDLTEAERKELIRRFVLSDCL
ncbi:hypothetical protein B0H13DRAFT_1996073, partial [Mycena leptocephala]